VNGCILNQLSLTLTHLGWPGGVGLGPWSVLLSMSILRCQFRWTSLAS